METRSGFDIIIVMMSYKDARGIHGKCPETIEMHLFAHLQSSGYQHQAAAQPLGSDALHSPKSLHIEKILWVEEKYASLGVKVIEHVLDSERHISVTGVIESWKNN